MLIVSRRWYLRYSNSFSTQLKYQIKLKVSVLGTDLPGKASQITAEYSSLQEPTPVVNMGSKSESTKQTK